MELKSKQQIENEVETYLNKTAQHLFVTESGYLYKIIPYRNEGELYYVVITMGKGQVNIRINKAVSDSSYNYYGNGTLSVVKDVLFPPYTKAKSIPNFKKMRVLVEEIKKELKVSDNDKLIDKIKNRLPEFEVVK